MITTKDYVKINSFPISSTCSQERFFVCRLVLSVRIARFICAIRHKKELKNIRPYLKCKVFTDKDQLIITKFIKRKKKRRKIETEDSVQK